MASVDLVAGSQSLTINFSKPNPETSSVLKAFVSSGDYEISKIREKIKEWLATEKNKVPITELITKNCYFESMEALVKYIDEDDHTIDSEQGKFVLLQLLPLCFRTRIIVFQIEDGNTTILSSDVLLYSALEQVGDVRLLFAVNNPVDNTKYFLQYGDDLKTSKFICHLNEVPAKGLWDLYSSHSASGCIGRSRSENKKADTVVTYTLTDEDRKIFRAIKAKMFSAKKNATSRKQKQTNNKGEKKSKRAKRSAGTEKPKAPPAKVDEHEPPVIREGEAMARLERLRSRITGPKSVLAAVAAVSPTTSATDDSNAKTAEL